jgi:hypothetical protein
MRGHPPKYVLSGEGAGEYALRIPDCRRLGT